jgi:hypothetical protein
MLGVARETSGLHEAPLATTIATPMETKARVDLR